MAASAALLIPADVWKTVGGFDPRLGSFFADVDWCMRARDAGFACFNVREARFASTLPFRPLDHHSAAEHRRKTLMLARNHAIPRGLLALALRHLVSEVKGELVRVNFWADYGELIGLPRRALWFLQNTPTHCYAEAPYDTRADSS
jgi:GT2 family glycosyltransferase